MGNGFPKPVILACLKFSPVRRLCLYPVGGLGAGLSSPLQYAELLEKFHSCFGVCPELPACCAGAVFSTNRFAAAVLGSANSGPSPPALTRHFAPFRCKRPGHPFLLAAGITPAGEPANGNELVICPFLPQRQESWEVTGSSCSACCAARTLDGAGLRFLGQNQTGKCCSSSGS